MSDCTKREQKIQSSNPNTHLISYPYTSTCVGVVLNPTSATVKCIEETTLEDNITVLCKEKGIRSMCPFAHVSAPLKI
jgi:hypothetical protein